MLSVDMKIHSFHKYIQVFIIQTYMQIDRQQKKYIPLTITYEEYEQRGQTLEDLVIAKYKIEHKLDYGRECEVYFAYNTQTNEKVAVKLINLREINELPNPRVKEIRRKCIKNQIQTMLASDNPYLLRCYEVYQNQDLILMIMQYCSGGTLQSYIERKKKIPQQEAWTIITNVLYGLTALHEKLVVVRDLKADNIIKKNGVFKIANFHYAEKLKITQPQQQTKGPCMGSLKLMAPQVVLRKPYGLKIDIWALGIIMFQMVYGDYPYVSQAITHIHNEIVKKDFFNKRQAPKMYDYRSSQVCFQFLKLTLSLDSSKRANTSKLYQFLLQNDKLYQDEVNHQQSETSSTTITQMVKIQKRKESQQSYLILQQIKKSDAKVLLIMSNFIDPIHRLKQQFKKNRQVVEFVYLLIVRCLNILNQIGAKFKKINNQFKNLPQFKQKKEFINALSSKVLQFFKFYSERLTKVESKFSQMITDWFSKKFDSVNFQKKERFFIGLQNYQYSKQEQIKYTVEYFNKQVKKDLSKYAQLQSMICNMEKYKQINQLEENEYPLACESSRIYSAME